MTKSEIKLLIIIISLIIGSFLCACYLFENDKIEIRSDFFESLLQFSLTIWLLALLLYKIIFWILKGEAIRNHPFIYTPIVSILGLIFIIAIILAFASTTFKYASSTDDVIIYQNKSNNKEKLIFQCWWQGIAGGNAHWRIIKTKNADCMIRLNELVQDKRYIQILELGGTYKNVPKLDKIEYKNTIYELESYLIKGNGYYKRVKINAR
jgi:hypothetical protein